MMIAKILLEIKNYQSMPYSFEFSENIIPIIIKYKIPDSIDLYQQSQRIEPKDPLVFLEELLIEVQELEKKKKELQKKLILAKERYDELQNERLNNASSNSWIRFNLKHLAPSPRRNLLTRLDTIIEE